MQLLRLPTFLLFHFYCTYEHYALLYYQLSFYNIVLYAETLYITLKHARSFALLFRRYQNKLAHWRWQQTVASFLLNYTKLHKVVDLQTTRKVFNHHFRVETILIFKQNKRKIRPRSALNFILNWKSSSQDIYNYHVNCMLPHNFIMRLFFSIFSFVEKETYILLCEQDNSVQFNLFKSSFDIH